MPAAAYNLDDVVTFLLAEEVFEHESTRLP
jgi:hypothetical protein